MLSLTADRVTPALRALFDPDMPTMLRAFGVLDGHIYGQIMTNDPVQPAWAAVREATFGTLYLGGAFDQALLRQLIGDLRAKGDVLIGRWPDDALLQILPPQPDYDGRTLYFTDRSRDARLAAFLEQMPPDCVLRRMDAALWERSLDRDTSLSAFGSREHVLEKSLGFFLMRDHEILCEAATGPAAQGKIEVGVTTHEAYRGRGYATITCARLIQACEELDYATWWDCAKQNLASVALARKLGYRTEREYRVLVWSQRSATELF
jgi:RimJ/RimL family protein N-acetyltransferase